jgi:hypothetical protein
MNRCPFLHGTVLYDPYPGYVHGKHPEICASGCKPAAALAETPMQQLFREATEYQLLFHKEVKSPPDVQARRLAEITESILSRGTYELTFKELEVGAQISWRNAPKCSNRAYWDQLRVLDCRAAGRSLLLDVGYSY